MRISLKAKAFFLIIAISLVLSIVASVLSSQTIRQNVDRTYRDRATAVSRTAAAVIDAEQAAALNHAVMEVYHATENKVGSDAWDTPAFDEYISRFSHLEQTDEFIALREQLRRIQDVNEVDCVYLVTVDIPTESVVYLLDAAYEDACAPGCVDPLYEANSGLLTDPTLGFPPYITDTEQYGWLVTSGVPVYDADNTVVGYVMTDISMDVIRAEQTRSVVRNSLVLVGVTLLISVLGIFAVNRAIVRPINRLSSALAHYNAQAESQDELEHLTSRSNDEIASLYASFQTMKQENRRYIDSLKATTQELRQARIIAEEMDQLAHQDALTGVGSKLAYDHQVKELTEEMRRGTARYGIVMVDMNALKQLNDSYGHERGNEAIRKTCALICEVFGPSRVYRFGGDEFVVIVRGEDCDHLKELVARFRAEAQASGGNPWERVNASIGYALYRGEDSVEDVFRRADHQMYKQKQQMEKNASN